MPDDMMFLQILAGAGVIMMLWRINATLSSLNTKVESGMRVLEDHEDRLRRMEGRD